MFVQSCAPNNFTLPFNLECGGCDEKMGANVCTENGCVCGSEGKTCLSTGSTPKCFSSNNTFTQNDIDATCKVGANIIHDQTTIL